MYTKTTYVGYYTATGVHAMWCGELPTGIGLHVDEEREVLYPEEGYILERIADGEHFTAVWLKDGDVKENYIEVEDEDIPVPSVPNA